MGSVRFRGFLAAAAVSAGLMAVVGAGVSGVSDADAGINDHVVAVAPIGGGGIGDGPNDDEWG